MTRPTFSFEHDPVLGGGASRSALDDIDRAAAELERSVLVIEQTDRTDLVLFVHGQAQLAARHTQGEWSSVPLDAALSGFRSPAAGTWALYSTSLPTTLGVSVRVRQTPTTAVQLSFTDLGRIVDDHEENGRDALLVLEDELHTEFALFREGALCHLAIEHDEDDAPHRSKLLARADALGGDARLLVFEDPVLRPDVNHGKPLMSYVEREARAEPVLVRIERPHVRDEMRTARGRDLLIGRAPTNDLVVNEPDVSRHHARLRWTRSGYEVAPMADNAVIVNGSVVESSSRIGPGDVMEIGSARLAFVQPSGAAEQLSATVRRSKAEDEVRPHLIVDNIAHAVDRPVFVLGKGGRANLELKGWSTLPVQALVITDDRGFLLSRPPGGARVAVNNQEVPDSEHVRLNAGDVIRIGRQEILFVQLGGS